MNLVDLIGDIELQQDEWSLNKPSFGADLQLQVVGHDAGKGNNKNYILKCSKCSQDSELFGEGYFKSTKHNLVNLQQIPCGCSKTTHWSKEQYAILCKRTADGLGYEFRGFDENWRGAYTKVKLYCEEHGLWDSGIISTLVWRQSGCPDCRTSLVAKAHIKPDNVIIQSFFASEAFHPDTEFWRSERKTAQGARSYWFMSCPDCGEVGEGLSSNYRLGQRPCACSRQRQQEAYINFVIDGEEVIAVKFGIARDSKIRTRKQNRLSVYEVKNHLVYSFESVGECKAAERDCKEKFDCGIVLKRDMPDGWSETTYVYNLDKIIEIYQRNGGTKK